MWNYKYLSSTFLQAVVTHTIWPIEHFTVFLHITDLSQDGLSEFVSVQCSNSLVSHFFLPFFNVQLFTHSLPCLSLWIKRLKPPLAGSLGALSAGVQPCGLITLNSALLYEWSSNRRQRFSKWSIRLILTEWGLQSVGWSKMCTRMCAWLHCNRSFDLKPERGQWNFSFQVETMFVLSLTPFCSNTILRIIPPIIIIPIMWFSNKSPN